MYTGEATIQKHMVCNSSLINRKQNLKSNIMKAKQIIVKVKQNTC